MKNSLLALLVGASLSVSGCSLFESKPSNKAAGAEQAARSLATLVKKTTSGLSITWEVPSEPTDGFIIRYGDDRAQLSKELVIMTSDLQEEQDAQAGPVYRYIIKNVPRDKQLYVSIAAFKGGTVSDFSEPAQESSAPAQQ
jgi:hypothetical protein